MIAILCFLVSAALVSSSKFSQVEFSDHFWFNFPFSFWFYGKIQRRCWFHKNSLITPSQPVRSLAGINKKSIAVRHSTLSQIIVAELSLVCSDIMKQLKRLIQACLHTGVYPSDLTCWYSPHILLFLNIHKSQLIPTILTNTRSIHGKVSISALRIMS